MARMPKESYELEKMKQENKKNSKSIVLGFIFLIIMTAIVLFCIFNFNDFNDTMKVLKSVTGKDILLSIGCLILYILICPISLCILCKVKKLKTNTIQNYLIGASEHFFNGITPYQTGAQPFQVYFFSRRGVKPSEGTGIAITNYLAQLIGLNILMIVSFIYAKDFFGSFVESKTVWIPIIGMIMNLITLAVFLCIIYCKWFTVLLKNILRWFCKFNFIGKHFSKLIPTFDEYCDKAQLGAKEVLSHPIAFTIAIILRIISLIFYYAIPFFILRGLNISVGYDYLFFTILATCFAVNAVVWIPTPGTSGGIEFSFTVLFALFSGFSGSVAAAAAILWRGITYYILLLVSLIEYLILEIIFKNKKDKKLL